MEDSALTIEDGKDGGSLTVLRRSSTLQKVSALLFLAFAVVVLWLALAGAPDDAGLHGATAKLDQPSQLWDEGLTEMGPYGLLPIAAKDGRKPWQVYARPFDDETGNPRIAILISGFGMDTATSRLLAERLPGTVSFAISPYAAAPQDSLDLARELGHEVVLQIPLEPLDYPTSDPGPHTLLVDAPAHENTDHLRWILSRMQGYVGVLTDHGSKFSTREIPTKNLLEDLRRRGLMVIDDRASRNSLISSKARDMNLPRAIVSRTLDQRLSPSAIEKRLAQLEKIAQTYGAALGLARAYPLSMEQIETWAATLPAKGIDLVPITAVANRQPIR